MSNQQANHEHSEAAFTEFVTATGSERLYDVVLRLLTRPNWRGYDADLDILYSWFTRERSNAVSYEFNGIALVMDSESRDLIGYELPNYSKLLISLAPIWQRPIVWARVRRALSNDIDMMSTPDFQERVGINGPMSAPLDQVQRIQGFAPA